MEILMLNFLSWEFIAVLITIVSGIVGTLTVLIRTFRKIMIEIALIKKDVAMNKEKIKENKTTNDSTIQQLIDLMNRMFDKNDTDHDKLDQKMDKLTDYIIENKDSS